MGAKALRNRGSSVKRHANGVVVVHFQLRSRIIKQVKQLPSGGKAAAFVWDFLGKRKVRGKVDDTMLGTEKVDREEFSSLSLELVTIHPMKINVGRFRTDI